jgi:hypothetical protein
LFGRCHEKAPVDIALRCLLAVVSFLCMFHPDMGISAAVGMAVVVATGFGIWRHRQIAPPKSAVVAAPNESAKLQSAPSELAPLLAEANRDIG